MNTQFVRRAAAVLVLGVAGPALAGQPINERRDAAADGRVTIDNVSGSVTVIGWDTNAIEVTGTLGDGTKEFRFDVDGKRATIQVILPKRSRNIEETDLTVRVPKGSDLAIETVSAWIDVEGVEGEVDAAAVSGDVRVTGKPRSAHVKSVSGDAFVNATTTDMHVETVSGEIEAEGFTGEAEFATVSGDIIVRSPRVDAATITSVSGDVSFEAEAIGDGRFEFESHSGSIELTLPKDLSAELDLSTFSGDIEHGDFGSSSSRVKRFGPAEEAHFTVGDGAARMKVSTFSGDIDLIRAR